jgi:hypothetical protein
MAHGAQSSTSQRTSPPEAVLPLPVPVVVVFALVVGALANTHLDPLTAGIADVEIAQINLVAMRLVLCLPLAAEHMCSPDRCVFSSGAMLVQTDAQTATAIAYCALAA